MVVSGWITPKNLNKMNKTTNTWRRLVATNSIEEALISIQKENNFDFLNSEITLLSFRLNKLKDNINSGSLSNDEINKQNNQIAISTLELIRKIEVHQQLGNNINEEIEYPKYCEHISRVLYQDEIEKKLQELEGWKIIEIVINESNNQKGNELTKTYKFASFLEAIDFMFIAAQYMEKVNHHPKWQNIWRSLTVGLSTWNIGHKISSLDFEIACYLEGLYLHQFSSPTRNT